MQSEYIVRYTAHREGKGEPGGRQLLMQRRGSEKGLSADVKKELLHSELEEREKIKVPLDPFPPGGGGASSIKK